MNDDEKVLREAYTQRRTAESDEGLGVQTMLEHPPTRLAMYEQAARTGDARLASGLTDADPDFAAQHGLLPGQLGWSMREQQELAGGGSRTSTPYDDKTGTVAKGAQDALSESEPEPFAGEKKFSIREFVTGEDDEDAGLTGQVAGGIFDALHNSFMAAADMSYAATDWVRGLAGAPPIERDSMLYQTGDFLRDNGVTWIRPDSSVSGGVTRGLSQFLTGFLPAAKALKAMGASGVMLRGAGAGLVADMAAFEAHEENLAGMAREFGMEAEFLEYLDSAEADTELEARLRNGLVGVLVGVPLEIGMAAGGHAVKAAMSREHAQELARMMLQGAKDVRNFSREVGGRLSDWKVGGGPGSQRGHLGFHGSRHEFDEFDSAHMGSGEGSQMFGTGHYIAENEGVASTYRNAGDAGTEGNLYTVDVSDEALPYMLDMDKPLSEQTPQVREALSQFLDVDNVVNATRPGSHVFRTLEGQMGTEKASQFLESLGLRGTRFLDKGSRGLGKGTSNMVVFADDDVQVLRRNGAEITQPPPVAGQALPQPEAERTAAHVLATWKPIEGGIIKQARALEERTLRALKGQPLPKKPKEWQPEHRESVARMMASDVKTALGDKVTGQQWYKEHVEAAHRVAAIKFPELATEPAQKTYFNFALAITSQGTKVSENSRNAMHAFEVFRRTGRFPESGLLGGGKSMPVQEKSFRRFNQMLDNFSEEEVFAFMNTDYTVKELKEAGIKVSGEAMGANVPGSSLFGPKIGGGFFSNMNTRRDMLTMDMWWRRTWGRYTGSIMRPEPELQAMADKFGDTALANPDLMKRYGISKKMLRTRNGRREAAAKVWSQFSGPEKYGKAKGAPKNEVANAARSYAQNVTPIEAMSAGERGLMREVATDALEMLRADGVEVEMADLQALLWYLEKDIYAKLGQRVERMAFDEALAQYMAKEGVPDEQIRNALAGQTAGGRPADAGGNRLPGGNGGPGLDSLSEEARRARLAPDERLRFLERARAAFDSAGAGQ